MLLALSIAVDSPGEGYWRRQEEAFAFTKRSGGYHSDVFVSPLSRRHAVFQSGLSRLVTWSADHGLVINKTRYVECLSSSKNTSSQLPFSFLDGEALSREHSSD